MNDKVFGELEYDYGWNGTTVLGLLGEQVQLDLIIQEEEDEPFSELQYKTFQCFQEKWPEIEMKVFEAILDYYTELREELGFDDDSEESYPEISNVSDLTELLTADAVIIPGSGIYEERTIFLAFSCSWDEENGVAVALVNEDVDEVGYQDIAF